MICPLCNNLLRITKSYKKAFVDTETTMKLITYQEQSCMNAKSMENGGNPCPNCGRLVNTVEHEEIVEIGT
jgi:ssDNA-binding Zn-finger/Zn-ribbon topoisomerase 1